MLLPLQLVLRSPGMFPAGSWGLLKVASGTSDALRAPSHFKGLYATSQRHSPASISLSTGVSNSLSRLAPVRQPPPRPHYAASPNDHIPLSQLAEASSGDSSLQSPARTEVCQVNLAPKTPKEELSVAQRRACGWKGQAAGTGVGAGWETKALLEKSWSFHVF